MNINNISQILQGSRLRPFFESVRVKIWGGHTCASAWSALLQSVCFIQRALPAAAHCSRSQISLITWREALFFSWVEPGLLAASARVRRCAQRTERNGGFGFQTKVKDRFLNQRRWTCWYSCGKKHASPVSDSQFSFTFLFVFVLKSLLSLLFTSRYAMEPFLHFFNIIIIWFLSVC